MSPSPLLQLVLTFCALFVQVDSYYLFYGVDCRTLGSPQSMEVIISLMFNKEKFLTYNSTENVVIGYTNYATKWARDLNNRSLWLHMEAEKILSECRIYGRELSAVDKAVRPKVSVRSLRLASGEQPAVLMCSAYGFYPKPISLSWLRNGETVTADVVTTEELSDGDWHYQIHSQLEFMPQAEENISCLVEHLSFSTPALFHWDQKPPLSESDKDQIAVGAAGLLLGVIMITAGLIYYKRKQTGWTSVHVELMRTQ